MSSDPAIQSRALRQTLGAFITGVTVVTTRDSLGILYGVTANSFNSVSLEPPLVLWSQSKTSRSYRAFQESGHFVVNILAIEQTELAQHFARSIDDKFRGLLYTEGVGGCPVLEGTAAHFECSTVACHPGGDHVIYIGRVERMYRSERQPLAFGDGGFMVAQPLGQKKSAVAA